MNPILAAAMLSFVVPQEPEPAAPDPLAAASAALQRAFRGETEMLFDRPDPDGPWWVRGSNFKASFDRGAWTFVPQPPPGAEHLEPLRFEVAAATVAGAPLPLAAALPVRNERRLVYDRGGLVETVDVDGSGVEQRFVFGELPRRGELTVEVRASGIAARAVPNGIEFATRGGPVTYSTAVAIDAAGRRLVAPTTLDGDHIVICVPAAFVDAAVLPITIDPRIAYAVPASSNSDLADPDVCASSVTVLTFPTSTTYQVWTVVHANFFGATDWDCFVQRYDQNLVATGGPIVIDTTTDGWSRPRIASSVAASRVLVVAQVRTGSAVFRVRARSLSYQGTYPSITVNSPINITTDSVDCTHPDVCGSATTLFPFVPAFFTVVWERAFSATDHDIFARLVDPSDGLSAILAVESNGLHQTNPSISKSCGPLGAATLADLRVGVVFQQRASLGNEDIRCSLLTADGQHVFVNNTSSFVIDSSGHNDINPSVSTASAPLPDGSRRLMVVYERTTSGNGDIVATCIDGDGTILAQGNVSALEGDATRLAWPQRRPSVDSDGRRFAVAYHEVFQGNTTVNDLDTRMSLLALGVNGLVVEEPAAILSFSGNREFNVEVASQYSGFGAGNNHYCTVNDRDNTNNTFGIDVRTYDGVPVDTVTQRSTGCGTAFIAYSGRAEIGSTLSLLVVPTSLFTGVVIGDTISVPFPGCPGCTLGVGNGVILTAPHNLVFPLDVTLIGIELSAQGIVLVASGGTCFGSLQLTDTLDFRVQ